MKRFLFLLRAHKANAQQLNDGKVQAMSALSSWVEELAETGVLLAGEPLKSAAIRVSRDFLWSVAGSGRGAVSGYLLIHAQNMEQAADIAQSCPAVQTDCLDIEVRPII